MRREFLTAAAAKSFLVCSSLVTGLTSLKLYSHYFSTDVYGVIAVALQVAGYLPVFDGGFRTVANRQLLAATPNERPPLVARAQTIYSWLLLLALLAAAVLMFGYFQFASHKSGPDWSLSFFLALGVAAAVQMFANSQAGLLLGLGRQTALFVISGTSAPAGVLALFLALHGGGGVWAFPISLLASAFVTYGLALAWLSRTGIPIPHFRFSLDEDFRRYLRDIAPDSWRTFRSQVSILLLFSLDLVIVALFCPPAEVAIYGVLSRVFAIGRGFLQSFSEAAWPLIARHAHGVERFQDWILTMNGWLQGAAGGVALVGVPLFIGWYMGADWKPSEALCWLFTLRFLVIGASSPASYYLLGVGDFGSIAKCCERETALAAVLGLALGWACGSNGVAAAFLLATVAGTGFPLWLHYARNRKQRLGPILISTWLRIGLAFIVFTAAAIAVTRAWR